MALPDLERRRGIWIAGFAFTLLLGGSAARADDVTLFAVDFSGPLHSAGASPSTGTLLFPRRDPTDTIGATQTVVTTLGPLLDQPVELAALSCPGSCVSNLVFEIFSEFPQRAPRNFPLPFDDYRITGVAWVDPVATFGTGYGAVFTDVFWRENGFLWPRFVGFLIRPDGSLVVRVGDDETTVGSHTPGEPLAFEIVVDEPSEEWRVSIDGQLLHTVTREDLQMNRFRTLAAANGTAAPAGVRAGFDDIGITAGPAAPGVPVLSAEAVALLAALLVAAGRRAGR